MTTEDTKAATQGGVEALIPPADYQAKRQNVLPSIGAMDWHLRQNRQGLIECGAIKYLCGRWLVYPPAYDCYLMKSGSEAAARKAQP